MKYAIKYLSIGMMLCLVIACTRDPEVGILNTGDYGDNATPLKDAADFKIGTAVGFTPMTTDSKYAEIVKRDFNLVTMEYHMKHGAVVQSDGSLNFTNTDAIINALGDMEIFGHTLGWHANQNAGYLKDYAGITIPEGPQLALNGGFEMGDATSFTNWSVFNSGNPAGTSTITVGSGPNEVLSGTRSMKVFNPTGYPGSQWRVQVAGDLFNTEEGKEYQITYQVKAASAGGSIRLSTGTAPSGVGAAQYQGDQTIGTAWQLISWTIVANSPQTRVVFDLGQAANTYFIDDVSIKEVIPAPSGDEIVNKLDTALMTFINGMVGKYKNRVKAWDVVNELFTDGGQIRNNANSPAPAGASDWFVWSEYLKDDNAFALKAFQYAAAADPNADLYINDYNLETSPAKLDALIAYVEELKSKGAKVDGIGTQMHVNWKTPQGGIDNMFKKLAATGLKIRVSELDVRSVMQSAAGQPTPQLNGYQAEMYKYIVESYIKHVPAAQRAGITVWGVTDHHSWLYDDGKEFPLLYDQNYNKKPAYAAFLSALR